MATKTSRSLDEKAADRREIADATSKLLDGGTDVMVAVEAVAERFGITKQWVRRSCLEHGVKLPRGPMGGSRGPRPSKSSFAILARLKAGEDEVEIAKTLDITRQRVNQVKQLARQHGLLN